MRFFESVASESLKLFAKQTGLLKVNSKSSLITTEALLSTQHLSPLFNSPPVSHLLPENYIYD